MQDENFSQVTWGVGYQAAKEALGVKNQTELAQKLGITSAAISDAKKDGRFPATWIPKVEQLAGRPWSKIAPPAAKRRSRLTEAMRTTVDISCYEELPAQVGLTTNDSKLVLLVTIPILGTVPAGTPQDIPGVMADHAEDYISLSGIPPGSLGLRVGGDSMRRPDGSGIHKGDVVVFVPERRPTHQSVVVVNTEEGESVLRRYVVEDGKVFLDADNPEYDRIEPNDDYRVVGVVIKISRDIPLV